MESSAMVRNSPQAQRNEPEARMTDAVRMADVGDLSEHITLSQLNPEHFPRWIRALGDAETNARRLREQLEELQVRSSDR